MATKSRLGKGLGALFPDLPGEPLSLNVDHSNENVPQRPSAVLEANSGSHGSRSSNASNGSENPQRVSLNAAPVDPTHQPEESKESGIRHDSSANRHVSRETSEIRKQGRSNKKESTISTATPNVSRETSRKTKKKRVSIPTLSEIAHPSDMFFGDITSEGAVSQRRDMENQTRNASRGQVLPNEKATAEAGEQGSNTTTNENIPAETELAPVQGGYLAEIKVSDVGPNLHQPRTVFDEDELKELADSIQEVGVLQPIVVRKRPQNQQPKNGAHDVGSWAPLVHEAKAEFSESAAATQKSTPNTLGVVISPADRMDGVYELIMGERRWRASQLAGLETIPAIVKTTANDDMLRDALLENLHRVNLNPLEEAAAFQQMIKEFGLTQAELSRAISKSRPQIANTLRLLNLPGSVQKKVAAGVLSAGHARALLSLPSQAEMDKLATRIIAEGLSVRSTEEIVAMWSATVDQPEKPKAPKNNPWSDSPIQRNLENRFDTKVSIRGNHKHGRIEIVFSSPEDMDRIVSLLMPTTGSSGDQATTQPEWV
ncbi:ParB/RepB/Spo0J family partition protein [Bifidobacterium sp.]|jgi:ParB family chromosome partitioning protein|uniref:ParB/RepB/Spo0J family partition protein n=1 Tax=Bifidobacterium sp. TaxID=41200 RepID=UPI0025B9FB66|nr:ParB/RepB/Spo0J family partition protein [Bifidobacterium sp.]MCH4209529.1 ParB/RepB/Spo0J family partition protein [Bifidobacterium sp.]MCI1224813.1 ParB/RepB/Spo0J family partition protein [Bifidobacterium sp.]